MRFRKAQVTGSSPAGGFYHSTAGDSVIGVLTDTSSSKIVLMLAKLANLQKNTFRAQDLKENGV